MATRHKKSNVPKFSLIALILLALVAIVLSVVLVLRFPSDEWSTNPASRANEGSVLGGFECDPVEAQMMYPLGNGVLSISNNRVSFLDMNGNEVFGEAISMESPVCRISGTKAIVTDMNGVFYMVIDMNHQVFSGNASNTIDYGSVNQDGFTVLLMDEPGAKGVARVLDAQGKGLFKWQSIESGYILSAEISPDSEYVDMSILNSDSATIQPILRRFSINGEAVAQFIPQTEDIYPLILYDPDGSPVLCGQSSITAFASATEKYSYPFQKIYSAASSDYGIVIIAIQASYDIPALYLIQSDGTMSEGIHLSEDVTPLETKGKLAVAGSGNEVVIVDLEKFQEKARIPVSATTIRVGFSSIANRITVIARDGVKSVVIP